jgi:hypothetical protein
MTEAIANEFENNLKFAIEQYRLDQATFVAGLEFIARARREFVAGQLIPAVRDAYIDAGRERPGPVVGSAQSNYLEQQLLDNDSLTPELGAVLTTAVMIDAIFATVTALTMRGATASSAMIGLRDSIIVALTQANLMPTGCDDLILACVEGLCRAIREALPNLPELAAIKRDDLTFVERRHMISARLPDLLWTELRIELGRQITGDLGVTAPRRTNEARPQFSQGTLYSTQANSYPESRKTGYPVAPKASRQEQHTPVSKPPRVKRGMGGPSMG